MGPFGDAEGAPLSCCKAQLSFGEIDSHSIRNQNQFFFFFSLPSSDLYSLRNLGQLPDLTH